MHGGKTETENKGDTRSQSVRGGAFKSNRGLAKLRCTPSSLVDDIPATPHRAPSDREELGEEKKVKHQLEPFTHFIYRLGATNLGTSPGAPKRAA